MALNPSGPISLGGSTVGQSINLELGNSATALASINSSAFRTLAGVPSGQISLSNFYGKSNVQPTFFASSSTVNASVFKTCFAASGNVYTFGYLVSSNLCIVTKLSPTGSEVWTRTLGISFSYIPASAGAIDIAEDSSGNVYVAIHYYLWKFDSSGTAVFNKYFTATGATGYTPTSVGVKFDSSCNLHACAMWGGSTPAKYAFAKFDTSGTPLWSTYIDSITPAPDYVSAGAFAPGVDSSGNVYFAGYAYKSSGPYYTYLIKLNSSGVIQLVRSLAGGVPYGWAVQADGSMGLVINGPSISTALACFDSSFNLQWAYKPTGAYAYGFGSPTLGPSNGFIVTATAGGANGYSYEKALFCFSSSGNVSYASALGAPASLSFPIITPFCDGTSNLSFASPGNNLFLQTQGQYFAMRIKSDGSQLYSYYIESPVIPGSIIMGAQSVGTASVSSSLTVGSASYTTAASTANSSNAFLSTGSASLSLTTISLDSVTGGQAAYTVPGTYSWVCPAGVTSVSAVAVGGGAGGGNLSYGAAGGGGGLAYGNNRSVTPGTSYTVVVGSGGAGNTYGNGTSGQDSSFNSIVGGGGAANGPGGVSIGDGGGYGGNGGYSQGGGGAGGYNGTGGNGGGQNQNGQPGINGSAGGGAGPTTYAPTYQGAYGGGGVSVLGRGNTGQGGNRSNSAYTGGSGGGSNPVNLIPGSFGGGGWTGSVSYNACCCASYTSGGPGRDGAVRIIWPGNTRTFPDTNTRTP